MRCPGWPCDTQFAILPEWSHTWLATDPGEIMETIASWPKHVCLTGGEPLIQRKAEMEDLGDRLLEMNYAIDVFTNGSQPFPGWARSGRVTIVMDWKLPGSGEEYTGIAQRRDNLEHLTATDAVKFVVADKDDLNAAVSAYRLQDMQSYPFEVFVGAAWGKITEQEIVDYILTHRLPWKLNVQVHKFVWEATLRGV